MAKKNIDDSDFDRGELTRAESFIDKYKMPLLIGGGAIVVVIAGIIGYNELISKPKEIESRNAYWNAFYDFEKDSSQTAINGTMNYPGFEELADEYEGTSGGNIANYSMGIMHMEKDDFEVALNYFDKCDFSDIVLSSMTEGLKGDCNVELGNYEEAVSYFEKAASKNKNQFTTPMYLKKAGITYEAIGDRKNAAIAYNKIKENWPDSEEAKDIDKFIVRAQN